MKIKRFLRSADLWDVDRIADSEVVIEQMGRMMDKGYVFASEVFGGDIVFEAEDGKFYFAVLEGRLEEIAEADIDRLLGYETDGDPGEGDG